jgi:hypothetical protein
MRNDQGFISKEARFRKTKEPFRIARNGVFNPGGIRYSS